jgi:hypothetical protein
MADRLRTELAVDAPRTALWNWQPCCQPRFGATRRGSATPHRNWMNVRNRHRRWSLDGTSETIAARLPAFDVRRGGYIEMTRRPVTARRQFAAEAD